jgi:hypothetical protein
MATRRIAAQTAKTQPLLTAVNAPEQSEISSAVDEVGVCTRSQQRLGTLQPADKAQEGESSQLQVDLLVHGVVQGAKSLCSRQPVRTCRGGRPP